MLLFFVDELREQNASLQAGLSAYAQTVKHHSAVLNILQQKIDKLEQDNSQKGATINELKEMNSGLNSHIMEKKDEGLEMAAAIKDLEKRVKELQQNNGTILSHRHQICIFLVLQPLRYN